MRERPLVYFSCTDYNKNRKFTAATGAVILGGPWVEIATMLFVFGVILLAGLVQTVTGFAYALIAVPLLAMVTGPREAIVLVLFTGMLMKVVMVYKTWNEGDFSRIGLIFAASLVGGLPGAYVLRWIDDGALKIFISVALLLCTAGLCVQCKVKIRRPWLAQSVVGVVSGFLGATTAFNGPPIVLYMMNEGEDKVVMRANLVRYFMLGNIATLGIAAFMGSLPMGGDLSLYAMISIPAVIIAWWLGNKVFQGINPVMFRRLAMTIIGCSALVTLGTGLAPWFRGQ